MNENAEIRRLNESYERQKMQNIKAIILFGVFASIVCCFAIFSTPLSFPKFPSVFVPIPPLPPGYKLLRSTDGEHFTVYLPREKRNSANIWSSKRAAVEYAIRWEEKSSDTYDWEDCPETVCEGEE